MSYKEGRNVTIFQDSEGNNIALINDIVFKGRQSIDWGEVENYLKKYVGDFYYSRNKRRSIFWKGFTR